METAASIPISALTAVDVAAPDDTLPSDETTLALMERIRALGLGGRLPSERELALDLKVSRTLLRDRLGLLESLGVLQRRAGAGTYIRGLDPLRLGHSLSIGLMLDDATTTSLTSVRMAIERQAAKEAATRQDHVAIAYMTIALDRMRPPADSVTVEQADFDFHSALIRASGSSSLIFFAEAINIPLRRSFSERRQLRERIPGEQQLMIDLHEPILAAVRDGLPFDAMRAVDDAFDRFDEAVRLLDAEH
jgi:GntR family transcriptional regulator, transcriptional repressor for pyruvate dehydrogenase complex